MYGKADLVDLGHSEKLGKLTPDDFATIDIYYSYSSGSNSNNGLYLFKDKNMIFCTPETDPEPRTLYFAFCDPAIPWIWVHYPKSNPIKDNFGTIRSYLRNAYDTNTPIPIYLSETPPPYIVIESEDILGKYILEIDTKTVPCQYIRVICVEPPIDTSGHWFEYFKIEYQIESENGLEYKFEYYPHKCIMDNVSIQQGSNAILKNFDTTGTMESLYLDAIKGSAGKAQNTFMGLGMRHYDGLYSEVVTISKDEPLDMTMYDGIFTTEAITLNPSDT